MPRPKGSKNKPKIPTVDQTAEKLAAQRAVKQSLEAEQADILAAIEKQKQLLKAKKKEIRAADKAIAALEAAHEKAEAIKEVTKLVSSGKSADEILELLNK